MPKNQPFARIAITLPPEDLAAADRLAAQHDRSRSWIVAEAIRQYAASMERVAASSDIGSSRRAQLQRDLALTPEQRVHEAEATLASSDGVHDHITFRNYDDFDAWRRQRLAK